MESAGAELVPLLKGTGAISKVRFVPGKEKQEPLGRGTGTARVPSARVAWTWGLP